MKAVENFKKPKITDVSYQAKFLTLCPLAPRQRIVEFTSSDGKRLKGYETEFIKEIGKTRLIIIGRKELGIPNGRDILVILYLIREALIRNSNGIIITRKPLTDYMDLFDIDRSEKGYKEAKERFKRIRYSSWFWDETGDGDNKITRENSISYQIIRRWSVFFDKKDEHGKHHSFIELSQEFWKYIKNKKIPYDLNMVRKIKDKPIILNLYLLLVYRTYEIWEKKQKKPVFIPFFGENGLMNQLSSNFKRRRDFKAKLINKWLPIIKEEWSNCPCEIEREKPKAADLRKKKVFKDGITIQVDSPDQLHVAPHWPKKLRQAQEEAKKELGKKG